MRRAKRYILGREVANGEPGDFDLTFLLQYRHPVWPGRKPENLYQYEGEPVGLRHWCPEGVAAAFGLDPGDFPALHLVEVGVTAEVLSEPVLAPTRAEIERLVHGGRRCLMRLDVLRKMREEG
jgi:hypothetical protein